MPSVVVPSRHVTVPVGVPVAGATAITVAVKVTTSLEVEGLGDEIMAIVVAAIVTVCVMGAAADNWLSPL